VTDDRLRLLPFGDSAVLVVVADRLDRDVTHRVHRLAAAIRFVTRDRAGWSPPVPGAASVLVPVDPLEPGVDAAIELLREVAAAEDAGRDIALDAARVPPGQIEIPTRYGGPDGPDLAAVAALHGLSEREVVELHASVDYEVQFLGFAPGFAYLGELPDAIATPRHATPRTRVPAGSVAIAARQTAVYPFASPGGWQIIGRTETRVWNLDASPPALLMPGTLVRFVPLD
jgi:KipI family sensor histidine kinase inhibitor